MRNTAVLIAERIGMMDFAGISDDGSFVVKTRKTTPVKEMMPVMKKRKKTE